MRFDSVLDTLRRSNREVFTTYDAAKVMGKPVAYASLMLHKSGRVTKIERGRYFINGADMYKIASNILFPSYVSLQAGLQYHGLIDQNVIRYSVIALKRHKAIRLGNASIEFVRAQRSSMFGYIEYEGSYVASPEKLFIDCLHFRRVGFATLEEALETAVRGHLVNAKILREYGIRTGMKTLVNRLGFLMEEAGMDAEGLLAYRYANYVAVHGYGRRGVNARWMVRHD